MTLVKFTPARDLMIAQNRLNHLFDTFFGEGFGTERTTSAWSPELDIEETKDALVVRADLPGMKKDQMHISVEDNQLVIRGERKIEREQKEKTFHCVERTHGTFMRRINLPATVLQDKVEAKYSDGVLEVSIPKAEEIKPREIEIKM